MITVPVPLGERSYDVLIGDGVLEVLPEVVAHVVGGARRAAVVTEGPLLEAVGACETGLPTEIHVIEGGEAAKVPATVAELCRSFARDGLTRGDVVVALGGGVVTDVAGFAAATYHRGVAYVNVATSLLAQVDAAVGGKTGVNLPEGKNLMGAFWQPAAVLCDTAMLSTLPPREWACGRGEMAKYAFLGDGPPDASILSLPLPEQVERCVRIKAAVVAADEREGDRRAVLNYGHTLGHALEAAAFDGGDLRHGEAVAVGLVFAALAGAPAGPGGRRAGRAAPPGGRGLRPANGPAGGHRPRDPGRVHGTRQEVARGPDLRARRSARGRNGAPRRG